MNSSDYGSGFRYYSKAFNTNKSAPSFGYMYDAALVYSSDGGSQTGAWRPAFPADFAANISVSGLNLTVGAVAITGNPQVQISNTPSVTLTNPVYQVGITGNNPIYVTGSFGAASNGSTLVTGGVIGITGTTNVNITNSILAVSGALSASISSVAVTGITNVTGFVVSVETGVRSVFVTNSAPLNVTGFVTTIVTGAVSASFDSTSIVNAQTTGNQYLAFISGRELINGALLSGISGSLTTNLNSAAYVTGSVNVYNTLPLYVTGALSTNFTGNLSATIDSVPIVNAQTTGNNYLAFISGRELINGILLSGISGALGSNLNDPSYVTGSVSVVANGVLPISGAISSVTTGWNTGIVVSIAPVSKSVSSSSTPSGVSPWTSMTSFLTGTVLSANPNRVMFFIQNIHTGSPLYVNLGPAAANTGNFSFILNPSAAQSYGGSSFSDDHYRGAVTVSGGAWVSWEL